MEEYQNFGEENEMIQRINKLAFELNDIAYVFLRDKTDLNFFFKQFTYKIYIRTNRNSKKENSLLTTDDYFSKFILYCFSIS